MKFNMLTVSEDHSIHVMNQLEVIELNPNWSQPLKYCTAINILVFFCLSPKPEQGNHRRELEVSAEKRRKGVMMCTRLLSYFRTL